MINKKNIYLKVAWIAKQYRTVLLFFFVCNTVEAIKNLINRLCKTLEVLTPHRT